MSSPRRALLLLVVADAAALHGTSLRVRDTTLRAQKDRLDYDHLYHIGSPVDVFKHCVLTALLRRCTAKASPLTYAETHAGRGLYAFDSEEASMLSESRTGIISCGRGPRAARSFMQTSPRISRRSCRTNMSAARPSRRWRCVRATAASSSSAMKRAPTRSPTR